MNEIKNLGVIIDQHLSFETHTTKLCSAAYAKLKLLHQYKQFLTPAVKYRLAETYVLSGFNHALPVYYSHLTNEFKYRIQKVQNSCVRYAYWAKKRDHISPILNKHHHLNMSSKFILSFTTFCYKIIKCKEPVYLSEKISMRSDEHEINIRSSNTLTVPMHNTQKLEKSFSYLCPKMCNQYVQITNVSVSAFHKNMQKDLTVRQCNPV